MWFKVYAGVYDTYHGIYEYDNEEDALADAYQLAIENYESYEGLHGIPSWNDCREDLIENCGYRLTSPGLGKEVGASLGVMQSFYQGLFLAPHTVNQAIKGSLVIGKCMENYIYVQPQ